MPSPATSFMDFSGTRLSDATFRNRFLIDANFERSEIGGDSDFRGATFVYHTRCKECELQRRVRFHGAMFTHLVDFAEASFSGYMLFNNVSFHGGASFDSAKFSPRTINREYEAGRVDFSDATFCKGTEFDGASFLVPVFFDGSEFQSDARFANTRFLRTASFQRATFDRGARFESSEFACSVDFNDAHFQAATSFNRTTFESPPKFFGTSLHEDTDFSGIDWRVPESSYAPSRGKSAPVPGASQPGEVDLDGATRAWDRLALIMSNLERSPERHQFYRLRMRAQRWKDRWSLLSSANWLFDASSEYGWSVPRALAWWAGHWLLMGLLLFCGMGAEVFGAENWSALVQAISTSFANAHSLLGLASEGGYLYEAREGLEAASRFPLLVKSVGVVQAFLGPFLLFLLLLTLRNRFRIR